MGELSDLDRLSVTDKDDLIRALFARVKALTAHVEMLSARVADLEGRLAKNSRNSSKPPSSDGFRPQPKSQRKAGQNPTSGQKGHTGHTLKKVAEVDYIETHAPPSHCDVCQSRLSDTVIVETRQVFDIPRLHHEATEHQVLQAQCACSKAHRGAFPAAVRGHSPGGPKRSPGVA